MFPFCLLRAVTSRLITDAGCGGIEFATQIAVDSNRNLRKAILMLEACKVERYPFTDTQKPRVADWERFIGCFRLAFHWSQRCVVLSSRYDLCD